MNSLDGLSFGLGMTCLLTAVGCLVMSQILRRRFRLLQGEVRRLSEDLLQAVELQSDMYGRICRGLNGVEERVLELAVPSADAPLPLERRHQVLTLARRGVSMDEIASRLNMPKGEAEFILNLRRFVDGTNEGVKASPPRINAHRGASAG